MNPDVIMAGRNQYNAIKSLIDPKFKAQLLAAIDVTNRFHRAAYHHIDLYAKPKPDFWQDVYEEMARAS